MCATENIEATIAQLQEQMRMLAETKIPAALSFKLRAAVCALAGDATGCEQNLKFSAVPAAEWEALNEGRLDY